MSISQTLQRPIRSFVIRASRMTNRQRHAIEHHWGDYGIDLTDGLKDVTTCFKNAAPVVLEIGFGMGDSLVKLAQSRPDINFIGVEVHPPGVGACVASASEAGLKNLLVIRDDAIEVLQHHVKNHSLHQVQILLMKEISLIYLHQVQCNLQNLWHYHINLRLPLVLQFLL